MPLMSEKPRVGGQGGLARLAGTGECGGLERVADVAVEQVRGARGEDAGDHIAVGERMEHARHRAVAAREHADVEVLGIGERLIGGLVRAQEAHATFVARVDEHALELEDGVGAET